MQRIMLTATRAKELRHAQCVYLAASACWSIRQITQHQAVTIKDSQSTATDLCHVLVSRQSMRRLFVRHGWRQLRRGGLAMWVVGDGFSEAELWNGLFDRHQTRRLSTADERGIAQFLENALQRGEPVTTRMTQDALQSKLGSSVSRNAAVKFLVRNGWRPVKSNGHIRWVSGHAAN